MAKIWKFKNVAPTGEYFNETISFVSNNTTFYKFEWLNAIGGCVNYYSRDELNDTMVIAYNGGPGTWVQAYRKVEFETEPTGALLAFLQANAVPIKVLTTSAGKILTTSAGKVINNI